MTGYNGVNRGRVVTAKDVNWLSMFQGNSVPRTYHYNEWVTEETGNETPVDLGIHSVTFSEIMYYFIIPRRPKLPSHSSNGSSK